MASAQFTVFIIFTGDGKTKTIKKRIKLSPTVPYQFKHDIMCDDGTRLDIHVYRPDQICDGAEREEPWLRFGRLLNDKHVKPGVIAGETCSMVHLAWSPKTKTKTDTMCVQVEYCPNKQFKLKRIFFNAPKPVIVADLAAPTVTIALPEKASVARPEKAPAPMVPTPPALPSIAQTKPSATPSGSPEKDGMAQPLFLDELKSVTPRRIIDVLQSIPDELRSDNIRSHIVKFQSFPGKLKSHDMRGIIAMMQGRPDKPRSDSIQLLLEDLQTIPNELKSDVIHRLIEDLKSDNVCRQFAEARNMANTKKNDDDELLCDLAEIVDSVKTLPTVTSCVNKEGTPSTPFRCILPKDALGPPLIDLGSLHATYSPKEFLDFIQAGATEMLKDIECYAASKWIPTTAQELQTLTNQINDHKRKRDELDKQIAKDQEQLEILQKRAKILHDPNFIIDRVRCACWQWVSTKPEPVAQNGPELPSFLVLNPNKP